MQKYESRVATGVEENVGRKIAAQNALGAPVARHGTRTRAGHCLDEAVSLK
jgi:hypothetical protein